MVRNSALVSAAVFWFFFSGAVTAAVVARGHHYRFRRVGRSRRNAPPDIWKRDWLATRHADAACPDGNVQKRDLGQFLSQELSSLQSDVSSHGGGTKHATKTVVDASGMPVVVNVEASQGNDQQTGGKSWSWSWSTDSSSSGSQPIKNSVEAKSSANSGQEDASKRHDAAATISNHQVTITEKHDASRNYTHVSHEESHSTKYLKEVKSYIVTSDVPKAANYQPFAPVDISWIDESVKQKHYQGSQSKVGAGEAIPRPSDAGLCNQRFPFKVQQFTADDRDERLSDACHEENLDEVAQLALDMHNQERKRYGLPLLKWNQELANMAACWADLKAYGHSESHFCASGENIAMGSGSPCYSDPMTGMSNAINSFLDEDRNWAASPSFREDDGHWTQVVWKDTRFVGCAVAQRQGLGGQSDMYQFIVCEYYPPGNVLGQFETQVPVPRPPPQLRSQCSANERHGS